MARSTSIRNSFPLPFLLQPNYWLWAAISFPPFLRPKDHPDQITPIDPHLYLRQRETIEEDLDRFPEPTDRRRTIYVMHSPPFETKPDQIVGRRFTGSRSIRRFIENTEPLLTLHGHIHEAPEISGSYLDRIGKTLCVNPGQSIDNPKQFKVPCGNF